MPNIQEYTVGRFTNDNQYWKSSYGKDMVSYFVVMQGADGTAVEAKWNKLTSSPAPEQGEKVHGFIEQDKYGPKFVKKDPKYAGGVVSSDSPVPLDTRGRNGRSEYPDQRDRAIQRQHSQDMAMRELELFGKPFASKEELRAAIKEGTDYYESDINVGRNISPTNGAEGQDSARAEGYGDTPPAEAGEGSDQPSPSLISQEQHNALGSKIKEYGVPANTLRLLLMSAGVTDPKKITTTQADSFDNALEAWKNEQEDKDVGNEVWEDVD